MFFYWKPRLALWSVPIRTGRDILAYPAEYLRYEIRPMALLLLMIQAGVTALCAILIRIAVKKRQ